MRTSTTANTRTRSRSGTPHPATARPAATPRPQTSTPGREGSTLHSPEDEKRATLWSAVPTKEELRAEDYLPLVEHLVREQMGKIPSYVHRDDLVSAGNCALASAIKAYRPDLGVPFNSYAMRRIRGALIDELRDMDWASRGIRGRIRKVDEARNELTVELQRVPTESEIAERLGIADQEVRSALLDDYRSRQESLERLQDLATFDAKAPGLTPEAVAVQDEQVRYLYASISLLPERTREIIELYFFADMTFADIGTKLGVHGSRIAQIVHDALPKMREAIQQNIDPHRQGVAARRRAVYAAQVQELVRSGTEVQPPLSPGY